MKARQREKLRFVGQLVAASLETGTFDPWGVFSELGHMTRDTEAQAAAQWGGAVRRMKRFSERRAVSAAKRRGRPLETKGEATWEEWD